MKSTLTKPERLSSRVSIETLFTAGSRRCVSFPVCSIYRLMDGKADVPVKLLVSVSKKHFKHATDRNRVKRQLRDIFRRNKRLFWQLWEARPELQSKHLLLALLWQADELYASAEIEEKIRTVFDKITRSL